jgi:8-amino-7-oxononanoate synthase
VGLMRLKTCQSPVGAEVWIDGRRYVNFGGSSYLGLTNNPEMIEAGVRALRQSGSGYQFTRNYQIATPAHQQAEQEIASFFGSEAGLYLAAGYYFGLVAVAALRAQFTRIFFDERAHHCLKEAIAASGLPSHAFRHLDVEDLAANIKRHLRPGERPMVVTDGLYSTFGEIAPLDAIGRAVTPYDGRILIDESHSFGVLGERGRGLVEHLGVANSFVVAGGSTGKALGVLGGIIPATESEVAAFRDTPAGRGAATGLPAAAAMCAASLRYVRKHPELLCRLRSNTAYMKIGLRKLGLAIADNISPVATFELDSARSMQVLQQRLMSEGIFVFHSTYLGAEGAGVIRCGIFADHTPEHMDLLFDVLRREL